MKTLRFGFLAMMLLSAFYIYADNDQIRTRQNHEFISLKEATGNRGMVYAIRTQVDPCILLETSENCGFYYAKVRYNDKIYLVYAVCKEWVDFFNQGKSLSPLVE